MVPHRNRVDESIELLTTRPDFAMHLAERKSRCRSHHAIDKSYRVHVRAIVVGLILGVFGLASARPSHAQSDNEILELLPRFSAAYVWTDDFPELLRRVESLQSMDTDKWIETFRFEGHDVHEDRRELHARQRAKADQQLEILFSLWTQLTFDELFDGEAALITFVDSNSRQTSNTDMVWIARCSSSEDDVQQFVSDLIRLTTGDALEAGASSAELERDLLDEEQAFGSWQLEANWFCWSMDEAFTQSMMDYLTGRMIAGDALQDDRAFQSVFRKLRPRYRSLPTMSLFVTEDSLPFVATLISDETTLMNAFDEDEWQASYLNELRGFGGNIYLEDETFEQSLHAGIAFDAFLLMTEPRRGALRGLNAGADGGLKFRFPAPNLPLARFSQFAINGDELYEGLAEAAERGFTLRPETRPETSEFDKEFQLMKFIAHITESRFVVESSDGQLDELESEDFVALRVNDVAGFDAFLPTYFDDFQMVPLDSIDTPFRSIAGEDDVAWIYAQAYLDERMRQLEQRLADKEEQLRQLRSGRFEPNNPKEMERFLEMEIMFTKSSLEMYQNNTARPQMLRLDDWVLVDPRPDVFTESMFDRRQRVNPQLSELDRTVSEIQDTFENFEPIVAVQCYWFDEIVRFESEHLAESFFGGSAQPQYIRTHDYNAPSYRRSASSEQVRQRDLRRLCYRQIDRFILTVSTEENGFRLNSILIRPDIEAEEDD